MFLHRCAERGGEEPEEVAALQHHLEIFSLHDVGDDRSGRAPLADFDEGELMEYGWQMSREWQQRFAETQKRRRQRRRLGYPRAEPPGRAEEKRGSWSDEWAHMGADGPCQGGSATSHTRDEGTAHQRDEGKRRSAHAGGKARGVDAEGDTGGRAGHAACRGVPDGAGGERRGAASGRAAGQGLSRKEHDELKERERKALSRGLGLSFGGGLGRAYALSVLVRCDVAEGAIRLCTDNWE
eukprot:jgi/Mesvir1/5828/Mv00623-RA.1